MRRSDERITLPNGLSAYGASVADVRLYQFIRDYFEHGISVGELREIVHRAAHLEGSAESRRREQRADVGELVTPA